MELYQIKKVGTTNETRIKRMLKVQRKYLFTTYLTKGLYPSSLKYLQNFAIQNKLIETGHKEDILIVNV